MRSLLLLVLLLGACTGDDWGYGVRLTPQPADGAWFNSVSKAADDWSIMLPTCVDARGPVFEIGPDGHPVIVVDKLEFGAAGMYDGKTIRVVAGIVEWTVPALTHEMGHALGFDHIAETVDPDSIMNPAVGPNQTISIGDVERAKTFFDCP